MIPPLPLAMSPDEILTVHVYETLPGDRIVGLRSSVTAVTYGLSGWTVWADRVPMICLPGSATVQVIRPKEK